MPVTFCFEPACFAVEWRGARLQRHQMPWCDFWTVVRAVHGGPERHTVPLITAATGFKAWKAFAVVSWLTSIGALARVGKGLYARSAAFDPLVAAGYCGCEPDELDEETTLETLVPTD
jgi:hypothetical protein